MYGLMLDNLWRFVVILHYNVSSIDVCVKLLRQNTLLGIPFSMFCSGININEDFTCQSNRACVL